jgi:hypothetical protein
VNIRVIFVVCLWAQATALCRGADMSPQLTALVHDVLQPYATKPDAATSEGTKRAIELLKNAHLAGGGRPSTASGELIQNYGKVLALGTRATQFVPDIISIHDAFGSRDSNAIRDAIRSLMKDAGRAEPNESALDKMVEDLKDVEGSSKSVERATMDDADRTIDVRWEKGTGKVKVDVTDKKGANGEPVRTTFNGEAKTKPDSTGKSLELTGEPAGQKPREVTPQKAKDLREKINGEWVDQDGNIWTITGSGSSITATKDESGHKVEYKAKYDLGKLSGEHIVTDSRDVTEPFPGSVKEQLASKFHPPYKINLDVNDDADRMEGTWASLNVTYSGLTGAVELIHDPYDLLLILTRAQKTAASGTALGMKEGDFP